ERVGQFDGGVAVRLAQLLRSHAARADREQLGADVDDPAEEALPVLELALPARHSVERLPGQFAAGALHVTQVLGERAEFAVPRGQLAPADGQARQPLGVETAGPGRGACLAARARLPGADVARATPE